jgi:Family of unknown function (DUF6796)
MTSRKIRLMLWAGCLGAAVLFSGDMLYYGRWGSARGLPDDVWNSIMAVVPVWRHHIGSITGPVGGGLRLIGAVGLWACCRRAAPRFAAVMLSTFYALGLFAVLQHGIYGPIGFALRYCGGRSEAVVQMFKLEGLLLPVMKYTYYIGVAIWILLTLWKKAGVPRWTVFLCPALITGRLDSVIVYVPAPLGFPLYGGWGNIVDMIWFSVLALTYRDGESADQKEA